MFEVIQSSTGTDIRTKVFASFCDNAFSGYEVAVAEIKAGSNDAKRLVHALKSNCSSTGAARAMSICERVETLMASGHSPEDQLLVTLGDVLQQTFKAMKAYEHSHILSGAILQVR
ncbi:Hpt domain-containing protein (plasmid) [Rhizobium sp. 32-5/1]|uniref:Hpt domain-containing protein n=1 Tax=Rhizobium sp. 32-5/1 TaxID=3019602 RepID=UPI00240D53B8|nr:Hpt domain-containing protein [Rhizobium sp. 32-5/1]WEZ85684.1 Hpt domain-containing protein [Rhizobium sp. 32-5/1]